MPNDNSTLTEQRINDKMSLSALIEVARVDDDMTYMELINSLQHSLMELKTINITLQIKTSEVDRASKQLNEDITRLHGLVKLT